jgi:hypothetical protein
MRDLSAAPAVLSSTADFELSGLPGFPEYPLQGYWLLLEDRRVTPMLDSQQQWV